MKTAAIAFRNIFRNKRRTAITEISIIIGMMVIIFASGILKSMETGWRDSLIYSDLGHIQILAKGLMDNEGLQYSIKDDRAILKKLKVYKEIQGISERINVSGLISNGDNSQMFIGQGIEPAKHRKMLPKSAGYIVAGRFIRDDRTEEAVVGKGLADKMGIHLGDVLTLAGNDKYESMNAVNIRVVGIMSIGEKFVSEHLVLLHIQNARAFANYGPHEVSRIVLTIGKTEEAAKFRNTLNSSLQGNNVDIYSWQKLSSMLNSVVALMSTINGILVAILLALTMIAIMNTILMSVFERTREIGTLMAIGASARQVKTIFIMESLFIGMIGVVLGGILGTLVNSTVSVLGGLHLPPPPGQTRGIVLHPAVLPLRFILVSLLVLGISALGALYPARHAAKQRPVEALRAN